MMGRDQKKSKQSKNIFKVAGSRSFKAKNKPKAVTMQLKKLNEVNKQKIAKVDKQLELLQEEVRQQGSKQLETAKKVSTDSRLISKDIKQYEESEKKSAEALDKLTDMSMTENKDV